MGLVINWVSVSVWVCFQTATTLFPTANLPVLHCVERISSGLAPWTVAADPPSSCRVSRSLWQQGPPTMWDKLRSGRCCLGDSLRDGAFSVAWRELNYSQGEHGSSPACQGLAAPIGRCFSSVITVCTMAFGWVTPAGDSGAHIETSKIYRRTEQSYLATLFSKQICHFILF